LPTVTWQLEYVRKEIIRGGTDLPELER
jgi:hypothetical protein